jgi:hypothetical protein
MPPAMNRLFAAGAVVAAVMAASAGARADYRDGNRLYADCTSPDTQLFCIGYVMAIADAARAPNAVGEAGFTVCGLEDVTVKQLLDVTTRYLSAHPEERHLSAFSLVAKALAEAFPCK